MSTPLPSIEQIAQAFQQGRANLLRAWKAGVPAILGPESARVASSNEVAVLSDLSAERFSMAIEAYRRGLITKADLRIEAVSLRLPGLSEAKLLELAEAAR